ncbi:hypothetical protein P7D22_10335 [Lichenihabitans sp. Uapishka_5]|uniref:hypothetical protein n=1 Tax=Lichenihabitans sp. Uapishka_5 TaxID=3037302 RepID=UPI0029E7F075|nr:hypothetical protein [Lichenihabitans sp. Uapishka_5]MDX7951565.1 hypothetical protein [Lichenihabitans sp. Uapishka_5]
MKTYTYQIGEGPGDDITKLIHAEQVYADSLGEAVDKAKAITRARPARANETTVCLVLGENTEPVWFHTTDEIRAGDERLAVEGRDGVS